MHKTHRPFSRDANQPVVITPLAPAQAWVVFHPDCEDDQPLGRVYAPDYESAEALACVRWLALGNRIEAIREELYHDAQAKLERYVLRYPTRTAFHEAGHAVLGTLHAGLTPESVALRPRVCSRGGKFARFHDSTGLTRFVGGCGEEDRLIIALAGPVAELLPGGMRGRARWKNDADVNALAPLFHSVSHGHIAKYIHWLLEFTKRLVCEYMPEIGAVAQALIERRELTGAAVKELLRWRQPAGEPLETRSPAALPQPDGHGSGLQLGSINPRLGPPHQPRASATPSLNAA